MVLFMRPWFPNLTSKQFKTMCLLFSLHILLILEAHGTTSIKHLEILQAQELSLR
jgi:hypothetical protein